MTPLEAQLTRECQRLRERVEELESRIQQEDAADAVFVLPLAPEADLTAMERRIAAILHRRQGRYVRHETIHHWLYSMRPDCDQPQRRSRTIRVLIGRIRKRLAGTPYHICSSYSEGYALTVRAQVAA